MPVSTWGSWASGGADGLNDCACSVTDRDLRLLRFVHDFGYVSTSTLAAMFWGRYGSAVRERLKLLHDVGLLDKLRPRAGRTMGAPEWVYG